MSDENNVEQKSEISNSNPKPWFLKPLGLSVISLSVVLILIVAASAVYITSLQGQITQTKNLNKENPNQNTDPKPDYAKLDLSVDELKTKATLKLNTLTNGVSLNEINAAAAKSARPTLSTSAMGLGSGGGDGKLAANAQSADLLVKEKGIVDDIVYYTETVTTENDEGLNFSYLQTNPLYDKKQPVKTQSWVSANYSKYVLSQNGKILSYNIYTPSYFVDYKSGKYAIKENLDQKVYLSGVADAGGANNSQISFLKALLSDQTLKDSGKQVLDGKSIKILETDKTKIYTDPSYKGDTYTVKYYIDQEKLALYKIENFSNDKLLSSALQTDYQEYSNPDLNKLFGVSDLGSVAIKEIVGISNYQDANSVSKANNKAKIIYPNLVALKTLENTLFASDNTFYTESESARLRNSIDSDPAIDASYLKSLENQAIVTFSVGQISGSVFRQVPATEPDLVVKQELKKTFELDGKLVEAKLKTVYYVYSLSAQPGQTEISNAPTPEESKRLEFQADDGLWYQISEYKPYGETSFQSILDQKNIKFISLTAKDAAQIDQFQKARAEAVPMLDYNSKLDTISSSIRLLPGDLNNLYKLTASNVSKSSRPSNQATCDKFLSSGYDLEPCMVEKYNGFIIYFNDSAVAAPIAYSPSSTQVSAETLPKNLNFVVLDISFDALDLQSFVDSLNSLETTGANTKIVADKNQAKIEFKQFDYGVNYYFYPIKGKTLMLSGSLSEKELQNIGSKADFDLGLAQIKAQIEQAQKPIPVDVPNLMSK